MNARAHAALPVLAITALLAISCDPSRQADNATTCTDSGTTPALADTDATTPYVPWDSAEHHDRCTDVASQRIDRCVAGFSRAQWSVSDASTVDEAIRGGTVFVHADGFEVEYVRDGRVVRVRYGLARP